MYEKQNFKSGDKLKAAQLNAMDEQIASNASRLENLNAGEDGGYYTPSVDAAGNLTFMASKEGMPEVTGGNIMGPTGSKGEKGEKGDKGDKGEQGEQGPKGDTGESGATGPQGPAGKNGTDASVTTESIKTALGYTPADEKDVSELSEEIENLKTKLVDGNEVAY